VKLLFPLIYNNITPPFPSLQHFLNIVDLIMNVSDYPVPFLITDPPTHDYPVCDIFSNLDEDIFRLFLYIG
jgi:hypothetical protein